MRTVWSLKSEPFLTLAAVKHLTFELVKSGIIRACDPTNRCRATDNDCIEDLRAEFAGLSLRHHLPPPARVEVIRLLNGHDFGVKS